MLTICIILIVLLALDLLFTLALRCRKGHQKWEILKKYRYAHRGYHDKPVVPENSLPAFRRAIERGFGAELDVHLLKDGTLAVFHDSDLKRCANVEGEIEDLTLDELKQLHLEGTDEQIPTFDEVLALLKDAQYTVAKIKKGTRKRSPAPPFTTSTMQQEASRKLGFQSRRTMSAAQQLYEGVELPKLGAVGLITYMRTDSLRISDEAKAAAASYIEATYGKDYLPGTSRNYKTRAGAQDAHEAIRPTMPELSPADVKANLTPDQYKLYKLIWERFIASQMADAVYDTVAADITAGRCLFKANGFSVRFDGFTTLYVEGKDTDEEKEGALPVMNEGDALKLLDLAGNQHFTQPPARYTEASLIKMLEENGIGRPSTYAPTISTILARGYIDREGKTLVPTQLGEVTTTLMTEHFAQIVDPGFTAEMEGNLDLVAEGKKPWVKTLQEFYGDFSKTLTQAEEDMKDVFMKIPDEETDIVCEKCGRNMVIKTGRFGKFLACPGFPECRNTKTIAVEAPGACPKCGGKILEKKSRKGKKFFGCEHNPECGFMSWDAPIAENCPKCGKTLLKKAGRGAKIYCSNENCDYSRPVDKTKDE